MNTALFPSLLGPDFDALPASVRRLHLRQGKAVYHGDVVVERGQGWLSRLCGWATRLPPAGSGPITVEIEADAGRECWSRQVGRHDMRSRLWRADGLLQERLGLVTFSFRITAGNDRLDWMVVGVRVFGLPLPARAFRQVRAHESEVAGRYTFHVSAALPVVGALVHYHGCLQDA